MSPQAKARLNLGALGGAIIAVAGMAWGGSTKAMALADERYANRDTFIAYQAGEALRHLRDSTSVDKKLTAIEVYLANLDSSDRCRRKQTLYCR